MVVSDNAIVYERDPLLVIEVGVRVDVRLISMGRPSCVSYSNLVVVT